MRSLLLCSVVGAGLGLFSIASHAQKPPTRNHPEIVEALRCGDFNLLDLTQNARISTRQNLFGLVMEEWTKTDLRQLQTKIDDCYDAAHAEPGRNLLQDRNESNLRNQVDYTIKQRIRFAPDAEAEAEKVETERRQAALAREQDRINAEAAKAVRERRAVDQAQKDAAAREQAAAEQAMRQAADARLAAEQQQQLANMEAQNKLADLQAQAQAVREQQEAADQAARARKQQAAAQVAADQATAERIAKAKRDQAAADVAAEEAVRQMPTPLKVDCGQSSILASVQATLTENGKIKVFKVYNSEPNPAFAAYLAAPALERVRATQRTFATPQCFASAMTSRGELPIAFRVFMADGDQFIEITERSE